ncbi:MAG: ribonuclease III [Acidobacteria bacterium]|nr:ribonuclease III [Acidobacteriota bacterium]
MTRLSAKTPAPLIVLEQVLGYVFRDPGLLEQALTHRSHRANGQEDMHDNERLEFLGDAVLGFLVSEQLYGLNSAMREGKLSRIKSNLVSTRHLHQTAVRLDLGRHLRLGPGEEKTGGRHKQTILANAVEAVVAAVYLDGGVGAARGLVRRLMFSAIEAREMEHLARNDYKSALQEHLQALKQPPARYELVAARGPEHRKHFTVAVWVGSTRLAEGQGVTKKAAEQHAAQEALAQLRGTPLLETR